MALEEELPAAGVSSRSRSWAENLEERPAPGGPAPLGWNNPPTPRWNASESGILARRCPHDISSTQRETPLRRKRP